MWPKCPLILDSTDLFRCKQQSPFKESTESSKRTAAGWSFPSTPEEAPVSTSHHFQLCCSSCSSLSPDLGWLSCLPRGTLHQNTRKTSDKNNYHLHCKELLELFQSWWVNNIWLYNYYTDIGTRVTEYTLYSMTAAAGSIPCWIRGKRRTHHCQTTHL